MVFWLYWSRRHERAMSRFRRMRSLQKFASIHSSVHNHFNHLRNIEKRASFTSLGGTALREWREILAAFQLLSAKNGDGFALDCRHRQLLIASCSEYEASRHAAPTDPASSPAGASAPAADNVEQGHLARVLGSKLAA